MELTVIHESYILNINSSITLNYFSISTSSIVFYWNSTFNPGLNTELPGVSRVSVGCNMSTTPCLWEFTNRPGKVLHIIYCENNQGHGLVSCRCVGRHVKAGSIFWLWPGPHKIRGRDSQESHREKRDELWYSREWWKSLDLVERWWFWSRRTPIVTHFRR